MISTLMNQAVEAITGSARVTWTRRDVGAPVSDDTLSKFAAKRMSVHEHVLDVYRHCDGFHLEWSCDLGRWPAVAYDDEQGTVSGVMRLPALGDLLHADSDYERFHKKWFDREEQADLKLYRPVAGDYGDYSIGLFVKDGVLCDELYCIDGEDAEGFSGPIDLDFPGLVDRIIRHLGLCDVHHLDRATISASSQHYLRELFPEWQASP